MSTLKGNQNLSLKDITGQILSTKKRAFLFKLGNKAAFVLFPNTLEFLTAKVLERTGFITISEEPQQISAFTVTLTEKGKQQLAKLGGAISKEEASPKPDVKEIANYENSSTLRQQSKSDLGTLTKAKLLSLLNETNTVVMKHRDRLSSKSSQRKVLSNFF